MMIECRECKNPVSDQAATCPHCGVIVQSGGRKVPVGSRRKATQFVWFFFWLMIAGVCWPIFSEGVNNAAGGVLILIGLFGWVGALVYRMTQT